MTKTRFTAPSQWHPNFARAHPIFDTLKPVLSMLQLSTDWPMLSDYNNWCRQQALTNYKDLDIHCVPQATKTQVFENQYEPRIYLAGELQTRLHNWHDFFNTLAWLTWPKLKALINALQVQQMTSRLPDSHRTSIENALTLLDENGVIIISDDPRLLDLIRQHEWQTLFCHHRPRLSQHLKVFTIGHALLEKGLKPYIGMTAKSLLFTVGSDFFCSTLATQIKHMDQYSSNWLSQQTALQPKHLHPIPILGLPSWDPANHDPNYYANTQYFRV